MIKAIKENVCNKMNAQMKKIQPGDKKSLWRRDNLSTPLWRNRLVDSFLKGEPIVRKDSTVGYTP
jgi:hypothetical protein